MAVNAEIILPASSVWKDGRAEPQTGTDCPRVGLATAEPGWREQLRLLWGVCGKAAAQRVG